jgi:dipeptidyl aminopeptidase/acylaminoacyl peptidase
VKLWDAESGTELFTVATHATPIHSVAFSPDGKRLVCGSWEGLVKVWDTATGKETAACDSHLFPALAAAFSPDNKHVASGSGDTTAILWEAKGGRQRFALRGHAEAVHGLCFSPDGKRLASASWDKTAKIWDVASGKELLTLRGHADRVQCVTFSPNGTRIATASDDKTIRVWDAETGLQVSAPLQHRGPVSSVAFSPDGKRVAAGCWSASGWVKTWSIQERPISLGVKTALAGFSDALTHDDALDTGATTKTSYSKIHAVPLKAGRIYQVDVTGDLDTLLRIEDSQQKALLLNDNVNLLVRNLNSRLIFAPAKDDAYRLIVTSFDKGTVGKYTLKVREVAKAGMEQTIEAELTEKDEKNQGRFVRQHKIQLEANRPYVIELSSQQFDTYLKLYDPSGKTLAAETGWTAGNTRRVSRIDFTPQTTATYVVAVTSNRAGETGAYTLRVQGFDPIPDKN